MKIRSIFERVTLIFCFFFCYVITLPSVDAERSVRVVKAKLAAPVRIHVASSNSNLNYAKKYAYGRPVVNYNTQGPYGRNKIYFGRRNGKLGGRNYANAYRNWTPNRNQNRGNYNPRIDNGRRGPPKPRKEPYPFAREPPFKGNKLKRKTRPQRFNPLQKPQPPRYLNELDDDYYFPEEAIRGDSKYEIEGGPRAKKRRRNPGSAEKTLKGPDSKYPVYRDRPGGSYKGKVRDTPVSYNTYIQQHPGNDGDDYEDEDDDDVQHSVKSKKKKTKKKSSSKKKKKESYEEEESSDKYQAVYLDDYDPTERSSKKHSKAVAYEVNDESEKNYLPPTNTRPAGGLSSASSLNNYNDFGGAQKHPINTPQYPPQPYSPVWSQGPLTTDRPTPFNPNYQNPQFVRNQYNNNQNFPPQSNFPSPPNQYSAPSPPNQYNYQNSPPGQYGGFSNQYNANPNGLNQFQSQSGPGQFTYQTAQSQYSYQNIPNQYNYQTQEYSVIQKPQIAPVPSPSNQPSPVVYSQPDTGYKTFVVHSNYNTNQDGSDRSPGYNTFSNGPFNGYQQSTSTAFNENAIRKRNPNTSDGSSSSYSYSGHAYVKNQSLSYLDNSQRYGSNRLSGSQSSGGIRADDENDFLKKHQNLYNKGVSGIPVQGDGYGKENPKKEYDIGYGDFQFDENLAS